MEDERIMHELRYGLPIFKPELDTRRVFNAKTKEILRDERTHILATCMAAYPFTPTNDLAAEFGIKAKLINSLATFYGVRKMKAMRSTINSENGKKCMFRNHSGIFKGKIVEKVDRNGRVVATFISAHAAANSAGVSHSLIIERCNGHIKSRLDGYNYRYKESQP